MTPGWSVRINDGLADEAPSRPCPTNGLADRPLPALALGSVLTAAGDRPRLPAGGAEARACPSAWRRRLFHVSGIPFVCAESCVLDQGEQLSISQT